MPPRESVLASFRPLDPPRDVVLGQFEGHRDLDGAADDSTTDTFVAGRLWVDSDRCRAVPFLLRTPEGPVDVVPGKGSVVSNRCRAAARSTSS
jgi:glucose-6-phosphate 1-dehydrogenase